MCRWNPRTRLHFFSPQRKSKLAALDLWTMAAVGADDVAAQAKALTGQLAAGTSAEPVAVFLENVAELANGPAVGDLVVPPTDGVSIT